MKSYIIPNFKVNEIILNILGVIKKSWTCQNCKYNLDRLKKNILKPLKQVKSFTIFKYIYKNCLKKMDLYQKKI